MRTRDQRRGHRESDHADFVQGRLRQRNGTTLLEHWVWWKDRCRWDVHQRAMLKLSATAFVANRPVPTRQRLGATDGVRLTLIAGTGTRDPGKQRDGASSSITVLRATQDAAVSMANAKDGGLAGTLFGDRFRRFYALRVKRKRSHIGAGRASASAYPALPNGHKMHCCASRPDLSG